MRKGRPFGKISFSHGDCDFSYIQVAFTVVFSVYMCKKKHFHEKYSKIR